MQHAIINAVKCMRPIKDRIARPVYQLTNHLSRASIPRTVYQPGKSSVRDLQSPSAHHRSVIGGRRSNPAVTTPMIALDFSTHLSASHNVALNQVINQSINQAQDVCIITSADFITSITAMSTVKAVKSVQFVPSSLKYLNRVLTSHCNSRPRQPDLSWLGKHGRDSLELKSRGVQKSMNAQSDFSRNPRTRAASRSLPQVVPQPLMSSNRQSNSQGIQSHQNHRKQRLESTEI
ncbi:hypothetical protein F511_29084 [Dorcoceras hygrometricum]|uniref:Uncharacterized protein n=1 Tax=Dorcoceras hygrometricum TaxID=472368 RepID=A0A2Z7DD75_9LAMI|nr:hypothetical protein F511_29084 [Dorcoceras hygrometricum]